MMVNRNFPKRKQIEQLNIIEQYLKHTQSVSGVVRTIKTVNFKTQYKVFLRS